ncbi:MAG: helix-turn-helix domain-containing protein [Lachnospiraceae bacterium]|nr:helix-turn-helix domain-containing protein [Lachnospiraceae bacterium]
MYTICIAEDEYYVQKSLEARIYALGHEIEMRGFASDGDEAERLYYEYRPDIYLVDISMPQRSGLQFIEKIRKEDPDSRTVFIIVSSYYDYENMRKAIGVNVFDYLRKPIVPSEFSEIIGKALLEAERARWEAKADQDSPLYFDEYPADRKEKETSGLLLLVMKNAEKGNSDSTAFIRQLRSLGNPVRIHFKNAGRLELLFFEKQEPDLRMIEKAAVCSKKTGNLVFCRKMKDARMEDELRIMEGAVNQRFFTGNVFREVKGTEETETLDNFQHFFLKKGKAQAEKQLLQTMQAIYNRKDAVMLNTFFHQLLSAAARKYDEKRIMVPEQVKRDMLLFSMTRFRDFREVEAYLLKVVRQLYECMDRMEPADLADRICEYIYANYAESLTLNEIADAFSISPSYLSHYFRKKKNQSIIRLIGDVRLEKAAEYLRKTEIPIADIAEKAGYGDGNYFSKVFRKKYGNSPSDYRKKWQNE